ncbi:MAG: hypothetical protein F6J93_28055 [Oscillatoria sp. SIO1A7]|nr:hypothetical protein [Oscillatoria sp. SIO1A7]
MPKQVSIFLNGVTIVDHAYIDDRGNIRGGSFNPGFVVTGEVDSTEKVVVDFSTVKKTIKRLLDERETGFDHKLWILEGYSQCDKEFDRDRIKINSPGLRLDIPRNAVKIFKKKQYLLAEIGRSFEDYLNQKIKAYHPSIKVSCYNSIEPYSLIMKPELLSYFTYCHGLKNSTSWGCQNNSHGHLSFISLLNNGKESKNSRLLNLQREISKELDRTIFLWKENVTSRNNEIVKMEYATRERGYFFAEYKTEHNKLAILDTETTIEFLTEYVCEKWNKELEYVGANAIALSEGLAKGGYANLNDKLQH